MPTCLAEGQTHSRHSLNGVLVAVAMVVAVAIADLEDQTRSKQTSPKAGLSKSFLPLTSKRLSKIVFKKATCIVPSRERAYLLLPWLKPEIKTQGLTRLCMWLLCIEGSVLKPKYENFNFKWGFLGMMSCLWIWDTGSPYYLQKWLCRCTKKIPVGLISEEAADYH